MTVKAVPTEHDFRPGRCIWCGEWVESCREEAGSTNPDDPCWAIEGDFGCDMNPITSEEGCGDHNQRTDPLLVKMMKEWHGV